MAALASLRCRGLMKGPVAATMWRTCTFMDCTRVQGMRMPYPSLSQPLKHASPLTHSREVQTPICTTRDLPYDQPAIQHKSHSSVKSAATPALRNSKDRIILVDGSAVLFRAYYKIMAKVNHNMITDLHSEADWVLTVFTALTTILGLLDLNPSHVVVVFDHKGGFYEAQQLCLTFRHTLFPEYKKNRPPTPDSVLQGHDHLSPALLAMGVKVLEVPGVEADDVIATLAASAAASHMKVRIISPDKDFFQILSPDIRLLRFASKGSGMVSFGMEEFTERFGNLKPAQFVDVLSLVGDTCDNIPGVPGIGEKTAIELITEFGSLENLLTQRDQVSQKRAIKGLLADDGAALLSKRLVALRADLPSYMIPFTLDDYTWRKPHDDGERLFQLLKALSSLIDSPIHLELQERILGLWKRLEESSC